jgi:hypothetical protein
VIVIETQGLSRSVPGGPHDFFAPASSQKFGGHDGGNDESDRLKIAMGYIQHLLPEYQGPRHLAIRDRLPGSGLGGCLYEREESRGATSDGLRGAWAKIMLVELVRTELREKFCLRWADRLDLPIGPRLRLRHAGRRGRDSRAPVGRR